MNGVRAFFYGLILVGLVYVAFWLSMLQASEVVR